MTTNAFIFAGGGTGGHLFPGLAIAEALRRLSGDASVRCVFLCSNRPLDARILTNEKAEFQATPAQPLLMRPRGLVKFLRGWGPTVRQGRELIRQMRADGSRVRLVAMGGFVAAPLVQAARVEGTPVTMVNLDAVPGKANRWISRRTSAGVFTALRVDDSFASTWTRIPPIVRKRAFAKGSAGECRARLGLDPNGPTLMVTGGSQGARTINELLISLCRARSGVLRGWQVLHQCGEGAEESLRAAYESAGVRAIVVAFTPTMADWWGSAELAVSRAGAGSVAEAWANRVPTLLLPYRYHADEHQRLNARELVDAPGGAKDGGAVLVKDRINADANAREILPVLESLLADAPRRESMRRALTALGPADGAERVARHLLGNR